MRDAAGRIVERVTLPVDLIKRVEAEAARRGTDFATTAGDLVAEALPEALREAAEALLFPNGRPPGRLNAETPPALPTALPEVCPPQDSLDAHRSASRESTGTN